jgi:hypothetical protein
MDGQRGACFGQKVSQHFDVMFLAANSLNFLRGAAIN